MTVTLTVTGNEVTDAVRALGTDGDGLAAETSFGIWPSSTNLMPNGGFETDTDGWAEYGSGASISRVATSPKFGSSCLEVVNGCECADYATLTALRDGAQSQWLRTGSAATFTVTFIAGGVTLAQATNVASSAVWSRSVQFYTAGAANELCTLRIERNGGGTFWVDGVQTQQNSNTEIGTNITDGVLTPYCHRDDSFEPWSGQPNLHPNGDFETNITGWTAFGTGATLSQSTDWARSGTKSLKVVVDTHSGIGARSELFASLTANTSHYVILTIKGDPSWTYQIEMRDAGGRAAIDFGWAPGKAVARKLLAFTTTPTGGSASLYIARNGSTAGTFYVDVVKVRATDGTALDVPDGVRGYGDVTCPAAGILSARQMWFAIRVRPGFGTTEHGAGSKRFFRWRDDDAHRLEAFYAISTDAWGVRRPVTGDTFFGAQIAASDVPCVRGQTYTLIGQYAPTWVGISLDGSGFNDYALSKRTSADYPAIVASTFEITSAGLSDGSPSAGCDVLWFAVGHGILTDADCTFIDGLGDTDPTFATFPHHYRTRFIWSGATANAMRRTKPTLARNQLAEVVQWRSV